MTEYRDKRTKIDLQDLDLSIQKSLIYTNSWNIMTSYCSSTQWMLDNNNYQYIYQSVDISFYYLTYHSVNFNLIAVQWLFLSRNSISTHQTWSRNSQQGPVDIRKLPLLISLNQLEPHGSIPHQKHLNLHSQIQTFFFSR